MLINCNSKNAEGSANPVHCHVKCRPEFALVYSASIASLLLSETTELLGQGHSLE